MLGKDPQPDHMDDFVDDLQRQRRRAHQLRHSQPRVLPRGDELGGYAWEKAGRIWYETLRDPGLRENTGFRRFAKLTVGAAGRLFGPGSVEQAIVADAWASVGLAVTGGSVAIR